MSTPDEINRQSGEARTVKNGQGDHVQQPRSLQRCDGQKVKGPGKQGGNDNRKGGGGKSNWGAKNVEG